MGELLAAGDAARAEADQLRAQLKASTAEEEHLMLSLAGVCG